MVFLRVRRRRNLEIESSTDLDNNGHLPRKSAFLHLFNSYNLRTASEKFGYFVAISSVDSIGEDHFDVVKGKLIFPVHYSFISFMPFKGEILVGTVDKIMKHSMTLKCGPIDNVFLSETMTKGYRYSLVDEVAMFVHEHQQLRIEKGMKVRFRVFEVKWIESEVEFQVMATIVGDFLGPV